MKRAFFPIFPMCLLIVCVNLPAFSQGPGTETITLTTYYPAPYGVYNQLATQTLGVGDNSPPAGIDGNDAPDPTVVAQQGDVWIAGEIGVGTTTPQASLHIAKPGGDEIRLTDGAPQIKFEDITPGDTDYWIHNNSGRLYFLWDADDNGTWSGESPWPLYLQGKSAYFNGNSLVVNATSNNVGIGVNSPQTPAPNGQARNLDVNDVYLRSAGAWVSSQLGGGHAAKMERTVAQSIPQGGSHRINFNHEAFDLGGGNIARSGQNRFVIAQNGVYLISASWRCGQFSSSHVAAGDSELSVYIYINGAEALHAGAFVKGPVNETGYVLGSDVFNLVAGDRVEMYVRHTAGGNRNTQTGRGDRPRMSVIQLQ
ncbi:MAG: hypothetical protein JSW40_10160 [Candidatus Omnitrophota bacterium]|nr:MAG: hypothetical protein JSW40_10160 [Candidatus Omnitrophota bacterium]